VIHCCGRELNAQLQSALNPARPDQDTVERFGWRFRAGDKVIQTENNYDKDVFNGDIGQIQRMDPVEQEVVVAYDDEREVRYGRFGLGLFWSLRPGP
jgi:exodeoxyribonuclease V alpha subunit